MQLLATSTVVQFLTNQLKLSKLITTVSPPDKLPMYIFYFKFDEILTKLCHFLAILPTLCSRCAHVLDSQWAVTLSIFMKYIPESCALSIKELNVEVFILQK